MKINIKDWNGDILVLTVDPNDNIESIKKQIKAKIGMEPVEQELTILDKPLDCHKKIKDCPIKENSTINLSFKLVVRNVPAYEESKVIGLIEKDNDQTLHYLIPGKLTKRYIRNTNATGVYEQKGGTCYAYAACSAYINTIIRIYGSRPPPSFKECFEIARYDGGNGGNPAKSIRLLEEHFHYGVICSEEEKVTIRDILTISVICSFGTSQDGWESVARGQLLEKANGERTQDSHAALVEGYDFNNDHMICKNSWGGKTARPRFDFIPEAAHYCSFTKVYFTLDSIKGKTNLEFHPRMEIFIKHEDGKKIKCAWMDETTAIYSSEYLCEYHQEKEGPLNYLGYDVDQFIKINSNLPKENNNSHWPGYLICGAGALFLFGIALG